jgi:type I restriction enzyme S subunit
VLIRANRKAVNPQYLVYLMLGDEIQGKILSMSNGATVHHLNMKDIRELKVPPIPNRLVQDRIADTLSAYDDLIENNSRRIKILEEMAQMIYREWFVNFRFPGHEKVKMVDSELGPIPEGWSVQPMNNVAEVIDCLHSKKPHAVQGGPGLLLQLSNISDGGKLDLTNEFRISQEHYDLWTSRIELRQGDCVVPNIGRIGAASQIPSGINAALGRDLTAIRPKLIGPTYLIEYLMSPYMTTEIALKKDSRVIMEVLNVKGINRSRLRSRNPALD